VTLARRLRGLWAGLRAASACTACACAGARAAAAQSEPANGGPRGGGTRVTSDSTLREWATRTRRDSTRDTLATSRRAPVRCAGQPISDVVVITQPPYANGLLGRFQFVARAVRELHSTTRTEVVRRFLILNPGDRCDELRRAESERILRAQPYLVDARIVAHDDGAGGVRLEVETRDEFSGIIGLAGGSGSPPVRRVRLGEANLMGAGVHAMADWYDGGVGYRDGVGGRLTHYQFLGRPYQLDLRGIRRDVGGHWTLDVAHPFYTDLQRIAWRASMGGADEFIEMRRGGATRNTLFYDRRFADVGGILRIGVPGRLSLFGFSLSSERASTLDRVAVLSDSGPVEVADPALGYAPSARFAGQRSARVNALWGVRSVRFVRVTGFDALTGAQDVRRGFQLGTMVGRSMGLLGSRDDDVFVAADLYAGTGGPRSFAALELKGEGRQDNDRNEWNGLVGSGRMGWYTVPNDRHRVVLDLEYSGVWRPRVPVQLALGAREGGARGFGDAEVAGARRFVARAEHRLVVGRPFNLGDLGLATFADAGRVWAGGAPYGVTTPLRASVGVGLLAAVPPNSRRLWRVDLAYPVTKTPGAGFQVIVSNRDLTRAFWREPIDVKMARERAVPASVFTWP
jgi:hypothetical protein